MNRERLVQKPSLIAQDATMVAVHSRLLNDQTQPIPKAISSDSWSNNRTERFDNPTTPDGGMESIRKCGVSRRRAVDLARKVG